MTAETPILAPQNDGMSHIHHPPEARPHRADDRDTESIRHPKLLSHAPVIRRGEDEFQVGLDPSTALIFTGTGYGELLTALDGSQTVAGVRTAARRAGLAVGQLDRALRLLTAAGLLADRTSATAPGSLSGRRVRLIGAGPLGRQVARLLVASGIGELHIYDDNPPEPDVYPSTGAIRTRSESLRAALAPRGPGAVTSLSHWSRPEGSMIDLTIAAADGPEIDRAITDHLIRLDHPHLVIRSLGNGACVGPLVLTGRTSCLRCHDLTRRGADPQWPAVLEQLSRIRLEMPEAVAAWAAGYASAQALAFLNGSAPELAGATAELLAPDFIARLRFWPAHPECGCSWLSPTEWGA
jgi:hypothetical protein